MSPTPQERAIAERAEDVATQLMMDASICGVAFHLTEVDGTWTRIPLESVYVAVNPGHVIKSVAEGQHYYKFFASLAKEHGPANAALDTARREWAKRGEGK